MRGLQGAARGVGGRVGKGGQLGELHEQGLCRGLRPLETVRVARRGLRDSGRAPGAHGQAESRQGCGPGPSVASHVDTSG